MEIWSKKLNATAKKVEAVDKEAYELSHEDIKTIMPKVMEFYNNPNKDLDVYHIEIEGKKGCILLVRTAEKLTADDKMESYYNDRITFKGCTFKHHGEDRFFSPWLFAEQWQIIKGVLGKIPGEQFFVHGNLLAKYHKIDDTWKADDETRGKRKVGSRIKLRLKKFLRRYGLENIDQMDLSDYTIDYSTNAFKVIP